MKRKRWLLCDTFGLKELRAKSLCYPENGHSRFLQDVHKDAPEKLVPHSRKH
jgi:hypothetical protein